jgi:hypothetical protein
MEGDDGDLQVDDDLADSPGDDGGGGHEEPPAALLRLSGGGASGEGPPKQKRNRKPTGWYDAMRDLTEPGADGLVPPRPSDEVLLAVNAAHGAGWVTLRQAREYVSEKRKTLSRREARTGACGALLPSRQSRGDGDKTLGRPTLPPRLLTRATGRITPTRVSPCTCVTPRGC